MRSLFLMLLIGILMGWFFSVKSCSWHRVMDSDTLGQKVESLSRLIEEQYVDEMSQDTISSLIIKAMMSSLDPHCIYFSVKDIKGQEAEIRGNFEGIGALLRQCGDTIGIASTLPGSPATLAGLQPGDRIITVDGDTVSGVNMKVEDVVQRIRGMHDEKVELGVLRYGESSVRHIVMGRDVIPTSSVVYSGMLKAGVGYIRISHFSEKTYDEFYQALSTLVEQDMKKLILDLRGNGGGVMESAVLICNEFLNEDDLIVYTKGAHQRESRITADGMGTYKYGELVVMIDEMSASASEIVSGAIQDNDRGTIVGRRSFGKGLVQRQFDFADGSAVWLTVARYYTPSGRCIQRPYDKGTDEYYAEYLQKMLTESDSDSTLVALTDTTRYYTKKGKVVYGGGGIYPDHVIPYYRDVLLAYYNMLINNRIIDQYAYDYVTKNYTSLIKEYPNDDVFVVYFKVTEADREAIVAAGVKAGIMPNKASLDKYGRNIDTILKAYIAQYLYGSESFYKIYVMMDTDLHATMKL